MRLLFLSSFYPPHELGGMEQLTHEVAARLSLRGHEVSVLTSRTGVTPGEIKRDNVIRTLHLQADIHYYSVRAFFMERSTREAADLRELRCAIDRVRPDVFVVWNMWNLSRSLPYWAEQWLPGRVAYYIASTWPMDPDIHEEYWRLPASRMRSEWVKRPLRKLALFLLRRDGYTRGLAYTHTMCVSRYMRDRLVAACAIPASAGVLYNGIDPAPFLSGPIHRNEAGKRPLRLLYFGSLVPIKGVDVAVEAMGCLRQQGLVDQVELTIVGRGHPDYVSRLIARVNELGLEDYVHFEDWIPRDEVPRMLSEHDVFLFTSTGPEAMARTVMEAMASRLLVIGSEVGGQIEMLHNGLNALTFPPGDHASLARQIESALHSPQTRLELAQNGQSTILEHFTLDQMVGNIETWLEAAIV